MRIAMIAGHACIRVQKMALPLMGKGHKVYLAAGAMPWGYENYDGFLHCSGTNHFIEAIRLLAPHVDIFHCHNEPSWFVSMVKEETNKPVILDVHDSYLARSTPEECSAEQEKGNEVYRIYTEERNNFQVADGLVFCGEFFGNLISQEFKLKQPQIVLPSYVPELLYRYRGAGWVGGLVYEGKLNLRSEIERGGRNYGFQYCIYEDLAQKCAELGIAFHIYSTRKDEKFKELFKGAFIYPPIVIDELIKRIMVHDWGLVGNMFYTREWEVAFPNKMFEYLAAQVPIVCMNASESSKFVEANGFGMTVGSVEELRDRWGEHEKYRANVIRNRKEWMMENHIHKLEKLYEAVL